MWWSHCRSLLNSGFHSFSVDAHSEGNVFVTLVCWIAALLWPHARSAPTSLRLIPRVEFWRLRSLASAGDYRELIRAVKSCMTGPVQRQCQWKRIHHPLCCHLLSWWAGVRNVAEACVCGKARTLSLFHFPRFACRLRLRIGSHDLGWNPQARVRSAASCRHPLWEARRGFTGWSRRSPRS